MLNVAVHPTAMVEPAVHIGRHTTIWDNVHIRHSAHIGDDCIIGEKSYVSYGVCIADHVKINAFVCICTGVTIERGVLIGTGTVFTNDRFPRATTTDLRKLLPSGPDENTLPTRVREGATIGAQCTIGCGLTIGRFAMVGMGSVVTRDVPDFILVTGNPARAVGYVCACGLPLVPGAHELSTGPLEVMCGSCSARYAIEERSVTRSA